MAALSGSSFRKSKNPAVPNPTTAVNLSAVIIKTGKGQDPCRPVCITADGSTFYKTHHFPERVAYYMKGYLNDELGRYHQFVEVKNANLTGSAIAALAKLR